jgi:hypothetical protein
MPDAIDASPITTICCCHLLFKLDAIAIPKAADISKRWPTPKVSYSLSLLFGNQISVPVGEFKVFLCDLLVFYCPSTLDVPSQINKSSRCVEYVM